MPFNKYQTANNAKGALDVGMSAGATTLILETWQGALFPSAYPYFLTIEEYTSWAVTKREIVKVTNKSTDTFTIVRSSGTCPPDDTTFTQGTTAFAFSDGAVVRMSNSAEITADMQDEIARLETDKLDKSTYNSEKAVFTATSTGTDAYAITDTWTTSYVNWRTYRVRADVANTGGATFQVNALPATTIKKVLSGTGFVGLDTDDITANQTIFLTYNSEESCFELGVNVEYPSAVPDPTYSPVNYTEADSTINGHLEGIDDVFGDLGVTYDWTKNLFIRSATEWLTAPSPSPDSTTYRAEYFLATETSATTMYSVFTLAQNLRSTANTANPNLTFADLDKIEMNINLSLNLAVNGEFTFYIGDQINTVANLDGSGVAFTITDNGANIDVNVSAHDWTTRSESSFVTQWTAVTRCTGSFKLVYDKTGWTLKLFYNGTEICSHESNLPTTGLLYIWYMGYENGSAGCGNLYIYDIDYKCKTL